MSISYELTRVEQSFFPKDYIQTAHLSKPVDSLQTLREVHRSIRLYHDGIVEYSNGSIDSELDATLSGNVYSAGWHIHPDKDAVNLSRGSGTPSLLAKNCIAAQATISAFELHRDALSRLAGDAVRYILWYTGNATGSVDQLIDNTIRELRAYIASPSSENMSRFERGTELGRHLLYTLLTEHSAPESLKNEVWQTYTNMQRFVPPDQRLELYPNKCDGYSIPLGLAHCRSVLHGELTRVFSQTNHVHFIKM